MRRLDEQLEAEALDALVAAFALVDVTVGDVRAEPPWDAVVDVAVDDRSFAVAVEVKSYCTGQAARALIERASTTPAAVLPMVVAERITAEAKVAFTEAGWSWLDRRGRLHLRGPGVRLDVEVAPSGAGEATSVGPPVRGRSGVNVAYWLLTNPGRSLSPTGHAEELGLAPSTVSTTVRGLVEAGLVDEGRAILPELFWELAATWRVERRWLATAPDPQRHLPLDASAPTWRRSGTAAAAAWGAPVVTGTGGPVELYVPGPVDVSIAVRRYGAAEPGSGGAVVAVAPAVPVCSRVDDATPPDVEGWLVAPKLAVALDLAQDRARGREILADWDTPDAVWR